MQSSEDGRGNHAWRHIAGTHRGDGDDRREGDVKLRPQVAVWERKVPKGPGVTGLWRPVAAAQSTGPDPLQLAVAGDTLYTLVQNGNTLTGTLEAPSGGFGARGGAGGGPIEGTVDGNNISFKVGTTTYTGTVKASRLSCGERPRRGLVPPQHLRRITNRNPPSARCRMARIHRFQASVLAAHRRRSFCGELANNSKILSKPCTFARIDQHRFAMPVVSFVVPREPFGKTR